MNMHRNKINIFTPLIVAFILLLGIYLGTILKRDTGTSSFFIYSGENKLGMLIDLIDNKYVDTVSTDKIVEKTIPFVLDQLDPHSVYIPAEELKSVREPLEGNFEGIGIQFNIKNDTILVISTIAGGPSEKVGLLPGDRIITINDSLFAGQGITTDDVVQNLKGPRGTEVTVGVKRKGVTELLHFKIIRDKIPLYSIETSYKIDKNTGYIKISRFAKTTHDEFADHMEELYRQDIDKLILDLRGNSGGYLNEAIKLADEFLPDNELIVYTQGKAKKRENYFATSKGMCEDIDLVILIDSWSASASEIVAGAVQDNDRGIIVGQRSFGKGLVQEPSMFRDGSAIRLTIARYYTPTGRCIQKPYDNGSDDYYEDIAERIDNGELTEKDSIKFPDSLKYTTDAGRILYGGGGIMPDIFVPVDTIGNNAFYSEIARKGYIYRFALEYTDNNRKKLNTFEGYQQLADYLDAQGIINNFLVYIKNHGLEPPENNSLAESSKLITTQLKAYISRNFFDNDGFYPLLEDIDRPLQKAIEVINNPEKAFTFIEKK
jgi:carboxyl-terminal processing protease